MPAAELDKLVDIEVLSFVLHGRLMLPQSATERTRE